jgi:hypothetical protein
VSATELARCNGTSLVVEGDLVGIVKGGSTSGLAIAMYVAVLVGVITGGAGVVLMMQLPRVGAVLLVVALADIAFALWVLRKKRRLDQTSNARLVPWLVFDKTNKIVRTVDGKQLCKLADARIERVFQAGSSSKALAVYCPKRTIIARGNPFGDDVDSFEAALRRAIAE